MYFELSWPFSLARPSISFSIFSESIYIRLSDDKVLFKILAKEPKWKSSGPIDYIRAEDWVLVTNLDTTSVNADDFNGSSPSLQQNQGDLRCPLVMNSRTAFILSLRPSAGPKTPVLQLPWLLASHRSIGNKPHTNEDLPEICLSRPMFSSRIRRVCLTQAVSARFSDGTWEINVIFSISILCKD